MCECNPLIRTPFCGEKGCEWPGPTQEESQRTFQVGDIVEAFGLEGKVIDSAPYQHSLPVRVQFEDGSIESFRADGKLSSNHKISSLILLNRPKKKVKKKFWIFVNEEDLAELYIEASTIYQFKPKDNQKNCQLVEIELEVEE